MKEYELWYDKEPPFGFENRAFHKAGEASPDDGWEKWSLPIGNGYMGVNVFGRTKTERLQITENSLSNPAVWGYFDQCNAGLNNFCELYVDFGHEFSEVTDYRRGLSLNRAIAKTEYSYNGIRYEREYFTSYPDKVLVTKFSADKNASLTFTVRPEVPFICDHLLKEDDGMGKSGSVSADGNRITLSGVMHYYGIKFEGQITVLPIGGIMTTGENSITVQNADSAILIVAVGTNYKLESRVFTEQDPKKKLAPYPHPHNKVTDISNDAISFSYDELLQRHIEDHTSLFNRANIDLNGKKPNVPTDVLLENYKCGEGEKRYLEELYFSYGRYLLIASSRIGTYPANLQGTWNQYASSPWSSGYWHNINVQMNYWPSFNTNLHDTFIPYIEYFKSYMPLAEKTADKYVKQYFPEQYSEKAGENGIAIGTGAWLYTIDGLPAPGTGHSGPGTGAFTTKLFADYYDFTMDDDQLNLAYIANLKMAKLLSKTLEEQTDGTLLVKYSASPEQRHNGEHYHTIGCAFDQQMVYECYNDTVRLADKLGIKDEFIEKIRNDMRRLDPVQIGASGQLKEYREEVNYGDIGDPHHRHISHLVGVYPGTVVNGNTPEWLKAAEVSLNMRGDVSTGWSTAHKLNAWARIKNGNRAHDLLKMLLTKCTLPNLWDSHPPFQIDGNFGATAGIAEMLLQSHEGYVHLLPALPDEWKDGCFHGLTARGGHTVSATWEDRRIKNITVSSKKDTTLKLYVGEGYSSPEISNGFMEIKTKAGETLSFSL